MEMKARLAKHNFTLVNQAIDFYLKPENRNRVNGKGKAPVFTFISLEDDNEPFPLAEVIHVLEKHLNALQAQQEADPREVRKTSIWIVKKRLKQLKGLRA